MALSSVINPEVITGKKKSNLLSAQNFISGGSSVGAGVLGSAANKIVNFQRAGVQPSPVDISSIVKSISTGVVSNFNNQAQTINNSVTNIISKSIGNFSKDYQDRIKKVDEAKPTIINTTISNLTKDYQDRIKKVDEAKPTIINTTISNLTKDYQDRIKKVDEAKPTIINTTISNLTKDYQDRIKKVDEAKPTGVLQKILGLYRDVIGFIQFFGKRKFVEGLRDNLKALQKSFTDSFEVAKLIRQVIIKIVKQLSNLPKASPSGGGGINLDIDVPGGGLKKTAPRGLGGRMRGMGRGKMLALGAGALGLGAAGAAATNALSGSDTIQPGSPAPEIPGNLLDGLTAVIDRFSKAIDSLVKGSSGKKSSGSSSGGGGGSAGNTEKPKETPGATPGAPAGNVTRVGTPEQQALLKSISFAEGTTGSYGTVFGGKNVPELEKGQLTVKEVYDMMNSGSVKGKNVGYASGSRATGKYQFMPDTLSDIVKSGAIKWEEKFTPEAQDRAILSRISSLRGVTPELLKKEGLSANVSDKLAPEFASFPTKSGASYYGQSVKSLSSIQKVYAQSLKQPTGTTSSAQAAVQAQAAPTAQAQVAQRVSTVSQPAQQKPQINYLPIDMSGGEQQAQQPSGGGGISAPPPTPQSGPSVPFLSATNTDNFLVLYSRMVYNIVDG